MLSSPRKNPKPWCSHKEVIAAWKLRKVTFSTSSQRTEHIFLLATQGQHHPATYLICSPQPNPRTSWLGKIGENRIFYNPSNPAISPTKTHLQRADHEQRSESILLAECAYSIAQPEAGMYNFSSWEHSLFEFLLRGKGIRWLPSNGITCDNIDGFFTQNSWFIEI